MENQDIFYEGAGSSLDPPAEANEYYTGYRVPAGNIGSQTSGQTADQLRELTARLSEGTRHVELVSIQQGIFDMIPKQHLKEISRLADLTGAETSIHAPIFEPSGVGDQGGWTEAARMQTERQMMSIIERSHEMSPRGNMPVVLHSSNIMGPEYAKPQKPGESEEVMMPIIDRESGQISSVKKQVRYYPGEKREELTVGDELKITNQSEWTSKVSNLTFYKTRSDEILKEIVPAIAPIYNDFISGKLSESALQPEQEAAFRQMGNARSFMSNAHAYLRSLYNTAYQYGSEEEKEFLKKAGEQFKESIENPRDLVKMSSAIDNMISKLGQVHPQLYTPLNDFLKEKSSQTFGNAAFHSFKKFGDNAPMIAIENVPVGMGLSRAEDVKQLVEMSREQFVDKAVKDGYSRNEAQKEAEKLIGATWDTGHINVLRRRGFTPKDLVEEAKKIAPVVKHVQLNDNFGFDPANPQDLPPGMGEVPIKEVMKEFEKAGFKGKTVFEGATFVNQFKTSPHPHVLGGLGSPVSSGAYAPPFWNQVRSAYGAYSSGYGTFLPEQHFSLYGAGFSGMPLELGGQVPGRQSRFSGTPME